MRIPIIAFNALLTIMPMGSLRAENPDPMALLRGVQQSRATLEGKLKMICQPNVLAKATDMEIDVEFSGVLRRFVQRRNTLIINGPNADENAKRLPTFGSDIEAAARAGLGKVVRTEVRVVYDGHQLVDYSEQNGGGADIRIIERGLPFLCFDIRTLGISRVYTIDQTLDGCLGLTRQGAVVSLVGPEQIGSHKTWRVKVASGDQKSEWHFWIEDTDGFRVHRFEYLTPKDGSTTHSIVLSDYGTDAKRPLLPKVVSIDERTGTKLRKLTMYTTTNSDFSFKPDKSIFGLSGLNMVVGTVVSDDRVQKVAGFWNGTDLSDSRESALRQGAVKVAEALQPRSFMWFWVALAGAGSLASAWMIRRWRSRVTQNLS